MERINVAIADDNERMVRLLGDLVKHDDMLNLVGTANNGEDMYKIIKNKEPDVVLLDIIMPKLDGISVMEKVNGDNSIKKQPSFIIVSAVGHESITENAFKQGACYYIMKPFDNNMVINRIKEAGNNIGGQVRKNNPVNSCEDTK